MIDNEISKTTCFRKKSECDDSNIAAAVNKTSIYSKFNTIMYKSTEWLENMKLLFVLNVDEKKC